jgi:thymidylate synthase (FAD)
VSRRYVDYEPAIYSPEHWRSRPENKKQGSGLAFGDTGQEVLQRDYADIMSMVTKMYERFIELNVAPEQARMMLPQSMMTSWWWSGSLDAFADMCKLRLGPDSQSETREVAIQVAEYMTDLFPVSWKALMEND